MSGELGINTVPLSTSVDAAGAAVTSMLKALAARAVTAFWEPKLLRVD